jgi:hypothetical protein
MLSRHASSVVRRAVAMTALIAPVLMAQANPPGGRGRDTTRTPSKFFEDTRPLEVTITANLGQLRRDKRADAPYRPATLSYKDSTGRAVTIPLRVQTRGIWRLKNCDYPPLKLNFQRAQTRRTAFAGQDAQKLVVPCRNGAEYDQLVLQEYNVYRIQQLLSPFAHRARLLKLSYADSATGAVVGQPRWAFVIEDMDEMLARLGGVEMKVKGGQPADFSPYHTALTGVFMYMIGGTDFSIHTLHNIEIVKKDTLFVPLPYDFDWTGAVDAPYAKPDPKLGIRTVRDRVYRGYCVSGGQAVYDAIFALFRDMKPMIYALYADDVGKLMEPARVKRTLEFFDQFYRTIDDPRRAKRDIVEACLP